MKIGIPLKRFFKPRDNFHRILPKGSRKVEQLDQLKTTCTTLNLANICHVLVELITKLFLSHSQLLSQLLKQSEQLVVFVSSDRLT